MKKIGLMGGSFDPIHIGHILLAQVAMEEMGLDEIWFIPTGCSYMKRDRYMVSAEERLCMTELALLDHPKMKCIDIEVKREGNTYTYETLEELSVLYPEYSFYFIFGADCLFAIENWVYPERIFAKAHIIAATRNGESMDTMQLKIQGLSEKYNARISLLPFWNLEISSTEIRNRVKKGLSIQYLVPEKVNAYIREKGFYQNES